MALLLNNPPRLKYDKKKTKPNLLFANLFFKSYLEKTRENSRTSLYCVNYTSMLCMVLNNPGSSTPQNNNCHFKWVGYCWWNKDELICKVLQWTPTHGHTIFAVQQAHSSVLCRHLLPSRRHLEIDGRQSWRIKKGIYVICVVSSPW